MNWQPARGDHSIVRASVILGFSVPLDANSFDELIVAARRAGENAQLTERVESIEPIELPSAPEGQPVNIRLPIGMVPPRRIAFRRLESNKIAVMELAITDKSIAFTNRRYERWAGFFQLISESFNRISSECRAAAEIKLVRLEYVDRFQSTAPDADHYEVLDKNSIHLTGAVRGKTGALHVHSGWFDQEEPDIRQLTNVNIGVADANPHSKEPARQINLVTMGQIERLTEGSLSSPLERLDRIHDRLKAVFGAILTPTAAGAVNLNG